MKKIATFILLVILSLYANAQDSTKIVANAQDSTKMYFYHKQNYGSESQFGHLLVFSTVGFSVLGPYMFWGYRPGDVPYAEGARTLLNSFAHPSQIKEYYGSYGKFFFQEFTPIVGGASIPNYLYHFMGEGMLSRKLYEYNLTNGMSKFSSRFCAVTTVFAAQTLNEIIEAPIVKRGDAISDIVFFNTAGIIAFSYDGFARLFSNEIVKLYYWPGQPMIDVRDGAMYNSTETYMLRTTLGRWTKAKLGISMGCPFIWGIGLTYPVNKKDNISALMVFQNPIVPTYPYVVPNVQRSLTYSQRESKKDTTTTLNGGESAVRFTWDREGSLMTTFEIGFPKLNFTLNMYPSFLKIGDLQLGTFVHVNKEFPSAIGLTMSWMPIMPGFRFKM